MSEPITVDQAKTFLVADLRAALKERGASIVGKKAELFERLCELLEQEENNEGAEKAQDTNPPDEKIEEQPSSSIKSNEPEDSIEVIVKEIELSAVPLALPLASSKTLEEATVSTTVASVEHSSSSSSSSGDDSMTTVRIDNFQRPLQARALKEWLERICDTTIDDASLWVNQIKTHCYVDFPTLKLARQCVSRVVGQRFPSNSTIDLEADITSVSASEAPMSVEATLKPGAWKSSGGVAVQVAVGMSRKRKQPDQEATEANDDEDDDKTAADGGLESCVVRGDQVDQENASKKQRLENSQHERSTNPVSAPAVGTAPSRELGGAVSMFKKATSVTNLSSRGGVVGSIVGGPSLFSDAPRKTACIPMLAWQPAPGAIVEKRLKARLMKASS